MSQPLKLPVTISIAPDQLARLDQLAADMDRSRSWLVGQAIERVLPPSPQRCAPLAAAAEPPPTGRYILAGSADRLGSAAGPLVHSSANEAGGGRAELGDQIVMSMERQLAHDLNVAEQQRQTRESVAKQNFDYLRGLR